MFTIAAIIVLTSANMDMSMEMGSFEEHGPPAICFCMGDAEVNSAADVPMQCIEDMANVCHDMFSDAVCETCSSSLETGVVTDDCFHMVGYEWHYVCPVEEHHESVYVEDMGSYWEEEYQMPSLCHCAGEVEIRETADVPQKCVEDLSQVCYDHFSSSVCMACESTFQSMVLTDDCFFAVAMEIHHVCYHPHDHDHEDHQHHDGQTGSYEDYDMGSYENSDMGSYEDSDMGSYEDSDMGSYEDHHGSEDCVWVNHVNDRPGEMTCDCVHHEDQCLFDGECVPESMCDPASQPEMVAATLDAMKHTYSLVGLCAIFGIMFMAWKCGTRRGDKYEYNLHLLAEAETDALVEEI